MPRLGVAGKRMSGYQAPARRLRFAAPVRRTLIAWAFVAPALLVYCVIVLRPLVDAVRTSFYQWDGFGPLDDFVGLDNYRRSFDDSLFWKSLVHTLEWIALSVPLGVGLGLLTAVLLSGRVRGRTLMRTIFFLPVVQASAVIALSWRWIYSPLGPVTTLLDKAHLGFLTYDSGFLGSETWALPAVAVAGAWAGFGFGMVIFLAGIQSIDPELYDAAEVDGAGAWSRFRHVTMPGLRDVTTTVLVLSIIGSFLVFDLLFILTPGGGLLQSTQVLGTLIYYRAFNGATINGFNEFGYAAALSVILMVIVFALSSLYLLARERKR
ncbi:MAG: sugar ABC transporter permease [Gaiellales bacterium]